MDDVYIIVLAYNEEGNISRVLADLTKEFKNVICVNDGSKDNTEEKIRSSRAILVSHFTNIGQGAAIQTGVEYALQHSNAKYFVTFDGDGQHNISDVKRMVQTAKKEKVNIVLGSRFLDNSTKNIPWAKRILLQFAVKFSNINTGVQLTDTHNGLRVFDRQFAQNLNILFSDYTHASEIIYRIKEHGFTYKEEPVTINYNAAQKGQPIINAVNIAFDMIGHKLRKQ